MTRQRPRSPVTGRAWRHLVALALAALVCSGGVARAADRRALKEAEAHYRKGEAAVRASAYDRAYREFEAGYNLSNRPMFLLQMANVERRRGQMRNAQALYNSYLLLEPTSRKKGEIQKILREIEGAVAVEEASAPSAMTPPKADSSDPLTTLAAAAAPPPPAPPPPPVSRARVSDDPPPSRAAPFGRRPLAVRQQKDSELPPGLQRKDPFYETWWFWTGVAVVVAGGVVGAMTLRRDPYATHGSLGSLPSK
jgi:hypothetical protein